jgi:hypothetical protein
MGPIHDPCCCHPLIAPESNEKVTKMMSLEAIRRMNMEIAAEAAEQARIPYVPFAPDEVDYWPPFPIRNLGYHEPPDWVKTAQTWFVDKFGIGGEDEPALSLDQFKEEIRSYVAQHPGHGFGIVEEGEFQVVIAAFQPE